jgi:hypothetical protein
MQCHEFEDRLNDVLDERANPAADSRLAAHAADCDDCRGRLAGSRLLLRGLSRLTVPAPAADFASRVVARAAAPPPVAGRPASKFWLACGVLLSSAAAALLAISIVWYARRADFADFAGGNGEQKTPAVVQSPQRRPRNLATIEPGKNRRSGDRAVTGGELLIEAPRVHDHLRNYRGAMDNLALALPQTAEQLNQMERVAPGIRQLRLSLALFWDTFCRTIPGARTEDPAEPRGRTSLWSLAPSAIA